MSVGESGKIWGLRLLSWGLCVDIREFEGGAKRYSNFVLFGLSGFGSVSSFVLELVSVGC